MKSIILIFLFMNLVGCVTAPKASRMEQQKSELEKMGFEVVYRK